MNINDFYDIAHLVRQRERLLHKLEYITDISDLSAFASLHLEEEMREATKQVLRNKLAEIEESLKSYGVDIGEDV